MATQFGRKYMVHHAERPQVESAIPVGDLIARGAIGTVLQVIGLGPHRLNSSGRPPWFFPKETARPLAGQCQWEDRRSQGEERP